MTKKTTWTDPLDSISPAAPETNGQAAIDAAVTSAQSTPEEPLPLTDIERMLVLGIQARDRELGQTAAKVQADYAAILKQIEERLGLPSDALKTTHGIGPDFVVRPVRQL